MKNQYKLIYIIYVSFIHLWFFIQLLYFSDPDSQPPHLERNDEQRQPQKKSRHKALLLDGDTQEQLIEWVQSSSPPWLAASKPDTVPATPCPLVKRIQPLHRSLCNV